jgi:exodeoxyribonuclease V alpha subunit
MNAARRCAERLWALAAPATAGPGAPADPALIALLERFYLQLSQGEEPLRLQPEELESLVPLLGSLPLEIQQGADGTPTLWSRRSWQRQRRLIADLVERLSQRGGLLVTGGAGSGKTSLVRELLQQEGHRRVLLTAPTGKAAARLREALAGFEPPLAAGTLHRWLEATGGGQFRRHRQRPLAVDTLVLDELSMVDGALMEALLEALPSEVRLLLLGDPGQLPPIGGAGLLEPLQLRLQELNSPCWRQLQGSHRFNESTALGAFVTALRHRAPAQELQAQLEQLSATDNLHWHDLRQGFPASVAKQLENQRDCLGQLAQDPHCSDGELLSQLEQLMVLCPRRLGSLGVAALNQRFLGINSNRVQGWPPGTPLLITRNDSELNLANGDLGVVRPNGTGQLEALIASADGPLRLPLALLPGLEPALALTVHKSQGSQAQRAVVVVANPLGLDPRLLYTALTRARAGVDLICPPLNSEPA